MSWASDKATPGPAAPRRNARLSLAVAVALALVPSIALLASVGRTPGFISDSVQYAAAADSLQRGLGLSTPLAPDFDAQFDMDGHLVPRHRFTLWPPGYPLALAIAGRVLALPIAQAAIAVNAAALVVMLVFVFLTARKTIGDAAALATTAVVGVLPAVQGIVRMVLSEPLFLAATAVCVFSLDSWMRSPDRIRYSWLAAASVAAAMHLRFTGIFLAVTHAMVGFLVSRRKGHRQWLISSASVAAGSLLGCAFLAYRLIWWGCATCVYRPPSTQMLTQNLEALDIAVLRSLPAVYDFVIGPFDTALTLMLLTALAVWARRASRTSTKRLLSATTAPLLFVGIYAASLVVTRTLVEFDALDTRLAAPISLGLDVVILSWVFARLSRNVCYAAAVVLCAVFVATGIVSNRRPAWRVLSDPAWAGSPIVQYASRHLREHPDVPIHAREASLLAVQLGLQAPVYWLAHQGIPTMRAGERSVVVLRPPLPVDTAALLDSKGTRIVDQAELVVWEIGSGVRSGL